MPRSPFLSSAPIDAPAQGYAAVTPHNTNTPLSYTRQWLRDSAAISGATAATYTLVAGDEGKMISATVTATNADGSGSATATAVGPTPFTWP